MVDDAPPLVRLVVVGARKSSDEPGKTRPHSDPGNAIYTARDKPPTDSNLDSNLQHSALQYLSVKATKLSGRGSQEVMNLSTKTAARGVFTFAAACMKATHMSSA